MSDAQGRSAAAPPIESGGLRGTWTAPSPSAGWPGERRSGTTSALLLAVHVAALWPIWLWYAQRITDGSDEPWGLVALVAVLVLVWAQRNSIRAQVDTGLLIAGAAVTLFSAASTPWLPALVRAAIGVTGLALTLTGVLERSRPLLALWALLMLSLPVIASLQFYAGYPLRLFTAWASQALLWVSGLTLDRTGVALTWAGRSVLVDAPCSGVQMLWVGMFLNALLSFLHRACALRFALNAAATLGVVLTANVLRNAILVVKEAGIVAMPAWTHTGVGLATFLVTALAIATLVRWKMPAGVQKAGIAVLAGQAPQAQCGSGSPTPRAPAVSSTTFNASRASGLTFLALIVLAALVPLRTSAESSVGLRRQEEPAWPLVFQGRPLERVALSALDRRFAAQLPGHVARFTDGERHLIVRAIGEPTRLLHPAADCFKGLGYRVERPRVMTDADATAWGCFAAERDGRSLNVCERISDREGASWTDVSAWYWAALLGRTRGPWLAVTVATAR